MSPDALVSPMCAPHLSFNDRVRDITLESRHLAHHVGPGSGAFLPTPLTLGLRKPKKRHCHPFKQGKEALSTLDPAPRPQVPLSLTGLVTTHLISEYGVRGPFHGGLVQ